MRRFHLTRNTQWRPIINLDKLWTLVPEEQKKGLTEDSEIVPVVDTLALGYGKILGRGKSVVAKQSKTITALIAIFFRLPQLPIIVKARWVSALAEYV